MRTHAKSSRNTQAPKFTFSLWQILSRTHPSIFLNNHLEIARQSYLQGYPSTSNPTSPAYGSVYIPLTWNVNCALSEITYYITYNIFLLNVFIFLKYVQFDYNDQCTHSLTRNPQNIMEFPTVKQSQECFFWSVNNLSADKDTKF